MNLSILFLVLAMISFLVAAAGVPTRRFNLIALGLALYTASLLVTGSIRTP